MTDRCAALFWLVINLVLDLVGWTWLRKRACVGCVVATLGLGRQLFVKIGAGFLVVFGFPKACGTHSGFTHRAELGAIIDDFVTGIRSALFQGRDDDDKKRRR